MKLSIVLCSIFFSSLSFAVGSDGCFQMYTVGAMYPVFCLDGSNEEGIGGAGARLSFFKTNLDVPSDCFITSRLTTDLSGKNIDIDVNGKREMEIHFNGKNEHNLRQGTVQLGKTELKFVEINSTHTSRFLKNLYSTQLCK